MPSDITETRDVTHWRIKGPTASRGWLVPGWARRKWMTTNLRATSFKPWPGSPAKSVDDRWASAASTDAHRALLFYSSGRRRQRKKKRKREKEREKEEEEGE